MNKKKLSARQMTQLILAILAVIFICILGYYIGRPLVQFVSEPEEFQIWVNEKGILGVLAFMGMVILQVLLAIIPGGPFEIGAGYAFGVIKGTLICDIAMTVACVAIFLFVKKFGIRFVELFVSREKIESVHILRSSRRSESIIFLLFLIPGTPKDLLSYLVGLTDMKLSHWIFICGIGRIPAILLSALSGSALGSEQYYLAVILLAAIIVLYVIGIVFYRIHNKRSAKKDAA